MRLENHLLASLNLLEITRVTQLELWWAMTGACRNLARDLVTSAL